MAKKRKPAPITIHILSTSSTLMGICAALITAIKLSDFATNTLLDETLLVTALLMFVSCFLSYLDIRSKNSNGKLEEWADNFFLIGLILLMVSMILLWFNLL